MDAKFKVTKRVFSKIVDALKIKSSKISHVISSWFNENKNSDILKPKKLIRRCRFSQRELTEMGVFYLSYPQFVYGEIEYIDSGNGVIKEKRSPYSYLAKRYSEIIYGDYDECCTELSDSVYSEFLDENQLCEAFSEPQTLGILKYSKEIDEILKIVSDSKCDTFNEHEDTNSPILGNFGLSIPKIYNNCTVSQKDFFPEGICENTVDINDDGKFF
ncbi:hypothetical protein AYI68_g6678 [Smittium mucronatum]|uniref:Uncharacterized protein n=1 Tax=Smittium mucronatum TaxID=133383 RepID=A0A1R0GQU6_9FUNG|nr:hypothetical protein AYI68_g7688 [Smittium mucronatum]OLY79254.1 hypothetical protein AYI68_g6678 [Smittium mucronatum]